MNILGSFKAACRREFSGMNVSGNDSDYEDEFHSQSISTTLDYFTFGFIWLLFLLCIIGNLLNVKVLSARSKKGWLLVEILLGIVSVSDMVAMTFALGYNFLSHPELFGYSTDDRFTAVVIWGGQTFMYFSDTMLVAVCASRVRSASSWDHFSRPDRDRSNLRRNLLLTTCIMGLLLLCALVPSYELASQHLVFEDDELIPLKDHSNYRDLFRRWQRAHLTIPLITAPVMFAVLGGLSLALYLLTKRFAAGSLRFRRSSVHASADGSNSIPARMAAGSVSLYFFTQAPVYVFNLFTYPWWNHGLHINKQWRNGLENVVSNLAMMNYSCDFLVYMGSNKQFRQEVEKLANWCKQRTLDDKNGEIPLLPRHLRARFSSCPSRSQTDSVMMQSSIRGQFG